MNEYLNIEDIVKAVKTWFYKKEQKSSKKMRETYKARIQEHFRLIKKNHLMLKELTKHIYYSDRGFVFLEKEKFQINISKTIQQKIKSLLEKK